ncbi:HPr family phosphocarrier protein [Thermopirellula anaerolimosa]
METDPREERKPQSKAHRKIRIINKAGLHARAATLVRKLVLNYQSRLVLRKISEDAIPLEGGFDAADGSSVLDMLSLCALQGDELLAEAEGPDAEDLLQALESLANRKFLEEEFAADFEQGSPAV